MTKTLASRGETDPWRLHVLIYGPPKCGKTVLAHHLPRTRTLDFDDGMLSVEWAIRSGLLKRELNSVVYETIRPPADVKKGEPVLDTAAKIVDQWIAEEDIPTDEWDRPYPQLWDTIIVDSSTFLTEATIVKGLQENKKFGLSHTWNNYKGGPTDGLPMKIQDWGVASTLFWKFIEMLLYLGKNVVVIAHEYHATNNEGALLSIEPDVIGRLRQKLPGAFDEVWHCITAGTRTNPKWYIQTAPDPLKKLGSRLGCLDPVEKEGFKGIMEKVSKFYKVPKDKLWAAYHGTEGVERAQSESEAVEGASI